MCRLWARQQLFQLQPMCNQRVCSLVLKKIEFVLPSSFHLNCSLSRSICARLVHGSGTLGQHWYLAHLSSLLFVSEKSNTSSVPANVRDACICLQEFDLI